MARTMAWRRLAAAAAVFSFAAAMPGTAAGVQTTHDRVVSIQPADWTPHARDGAARKILQIGTRIYVGGTFSTVRQTADSADLSRPYLFAFNASTGRIDGTFRPALDGSVESLAAAPDGKSLYVGGYFNNASGAAASKVARLDAVTGLPVPGFSPPAFSARVDDLQVVGSRLIVGGGFRRVGRTLRPALASLNATTGALDPFIDLAFDEPRRTATTSAPLSVADLDVTPDKHTLVVLGNFNTVSGQPRHQLAVIDVSGPTATLEDWATPGYEPTCGTRFPSYVRGLDISPDGSYFVVSTTGGHFSGTLCDSAARWELTASGTAIKPTWINKTGGDTLWSAGITGPVVYLGGHQRWLNNPYAKDAAGPGAVSRPGVAAVDPRNGLPFTWNPTKTRGVATFDLYATPQGLWLASDGNQVRWKYHGKLALMPTAGGQVLPPDHTGTLPAEVYLPGSVGLSAVSFTGTSATADRTLSKTGVDWQLVHGATMIDGTVYAAQADGTLQARSFDGSVFGAARVVDLNGLGEAGFANDLATMTGMFYDRAAGRLYYTVEGKRQLYYRYFTPQSQVLGAARFEAYRWNAGGVGWASVAGMFLTGGKLYYGSTDGQLRNVGFSAGKLVGRSALVSGSGVAKHSWNSRGMFLDSGV